MDRWIGTRSIGTSVVHVLTLVLVLVVVVVVVPAVVPSLKPSECPWSSNLTDLHSSCSCSYVLSKLNVQCNAVNVTRLLDALRSGYGTSSSGIIPIEMLQVTNSSLPILADNAFYNLRVTHIHLAHCRLRNISALALKTSNLEDGLLSLSLPNNELTSRALVPIRKLRSLNSLDLSMNKINKLDDDAFKGLVALDTLNLMENNITTIGQLAFRGLESGLKNLNLKATGLIELPEALVNLSALAFLDLAHNSIEDIGQLYFQSMDSLTALSLERNNLDVLHPHAFKGLDDTMSSLSLLNNDFNEIPTKAVAILKQLKVLDLGFNSIYEIPQDSFEGLTSLTLLALDGNPLVTIPFGALKHLHSTLRGLSIGGKSLVCDCHIRWITEWVREYDLQVTSRERNPQFCGHPEAQQNKNLYLLRPAQLVCPETTTTGTTTPTSTSPITTTTSPITTPTTTIPTTTQTTTGVPITQHAKSLDIVNVTNNPLFSINNRSSRKDNIDPEDIKIRDAYRDNTNVVLTWELLTSPNNIPIAASGFRVIYRTFGDDHYKEGAVLPLRVRKFKMTNVPSSECCLIVCVVSLGLNLTPTSGSDLTNNFTLENVPNSNCRELKATDEIGNELMTASVNGQSNVDMLVIILMVAIGCTLIVAVIVLCTCCCRRRRRTGQEKSLPLPLPPPPPPPIVELPPLEQTSMKPEWDQTSAYSSRSIPRARMYHMARSGGTVNSAYLPDDARSHMSYSKHYNHRVDPDDRVTHSMIDGQYGTGYPDSNYPMGRSETNRSSKSLAMSMPVYHIQPNNNNNNNNNNNHHHHTNQNNRKKNKSQQRNGTSKWSASQPHHGSMHSLSNGYGDRETGYFNHPNPWSSPSDADHYNPSSSHVSQPFNKRDFT